MGIQTGLDSRFLEIYLVKYSNNPLEVAAEMPSPKSASDSLGSDPVEESPQSTTVIGGVSEVETRRQPWKEIVEEIDEANAKNDDYIPFRDTTSEYFVSKTGYYYNHTT